MVDVVAQPRCHVALGGSLYIPNNEDKGALVAFQRHVLACRDAWLSRESQGHQEVCRIYSPSEVQATLLTEYRVHSQWLASIRYPPNSPPSLAPLVGDGQVYRSLKSQLPEPGYPRSIGEDFYYTYGPFANDQGLDPMWIKCNQEVQGLHPSCLFDKFDTKTQPLPKPETHVNGTGQRWYQQEGSELPGVM